ncbi:MAG: hypothetical protein PHY31_03310, partial [Smithellaceae bacterium]|nr:hypothetical protein [Smithellaceae bacterium]
MKRPGGLFCCLLFLMLLSPGLARSDNASLLGLSARSAALGGAMTAVVDDYTAAYYNPAGLAWAFPKGGWFIAGVDLVYTTRSFAAVDTAGTQVKHDFETKGIALGMAFDLKRLIKVKDCTFGISLYIPSTGLLNIDLPTSASQYFFPVY